MWQAEFGFFVFFLYLPVYSEFSTHLFALLLPSSTHWIPVCVPSKGCWELSLQSVDQLKRGLSQVMQKFRKQVFIDEENQI